MGVTRSPSVVWNAHSPLVFSSKYKTHTKEIRMAYSWDNRVKFVVRYMYDIDNNGFLDKNDFECLAVRNTVIETKGKWDEGVYKKNQEIMANLWNEIADLADFNKDGEVSVEEFKKGIEMSCKGKNYADFPKAFKFFIDSSFRTIDVRSARMRVLVRLPGKQQVWQRLQRRLFLWSSCCLNLSWSWSSPTTTSLTYPCSCPSPTPLFCTCCFSQAPTYPLRHRATHPYIEKRAFQVSIYWTSKLA